DAPRRLDLRLLPELPRPAVILYVEQGPGRSLRLRRLLVESHILAMKRSNHGSVDSVQLRQLLHRGTARARLKGAAQRSNPCLRSRRRAGEPTAVQLELLSNTPTPVEERRNSTHVLVSAELDQAPFF